MTVAFVTMSSSVEFSAVSFSNALVLESRSVEFVNTFAMALVFGGGMRSELQGLSTRNNKNISLRKEQFMALN